jgi:serine/threonine protein kinase
MRRKQPYTEREARDAMHSLLLALACMHNRDIVHRDVKVCN